MKATLPYPLAMVMSAGLALGLDHPFLWIWLTWLIAAIASMVLGGSTAKKLGFNIAFLFLALAVLEGWFAHKATSPIRDEGTSYEDYLQHDHEVLGYAPKPGVTVERQKYFGDELMYEVDYRFDQDSLRVSQQGDTNASMSVAFFGGSFTFGEGVADAETLPSQVGASSDMAIYNFGLHGYGPHQMLAAIESGYAAERMKVKPYYVIHQALMWHVLRSGGRAEWDPDGPAYALQEDGSVARLGGFRENRKLMARLFDRSFLFVKLRDILANKSGRDIALYLAIIKQAAAASEKAWPGSAFHVLLWDTEVYPHRQQVIDGMKEAGLTVHLVSEILPIDGEEARAFQLHAADNHPTPEAYEKIASYLLHEVIE